MPRCAAYLRVSHRDSVESGAGLAAQAREARRMFMELSEVNDEFHWHANNFQHDSPGFFADLAVSAWKVQFHRRPAAIELMKTLKRGDTLLVAVSSRMFRSISDMVYTMRAFKDAGINIRFGDVPVSTDTMVGDMMLTLLVMFAEWESRIKSLRNREAAAIRKRRGEDRYRGAPLDTPPVKPVLQPDEDIASLLTGKKRVFRHAADHATKPGRVFIYTRCSHLESVESGLGLEWQRKVCMRRAQNLMTGNPNLTFGGEFTDGAVSAWRHRLKNRPQGKKLFDGLQDGDHVIFARLDRGFRTLRDMTDTVPDINQRGATVHFADEGIDMSTIWGQAVIAIMAVFAEMESSMKSERTCSALRELRLQGRGINNLKGFSKAKGIGGTQMVPNRREIAKMRLSYFLTVVCGMGRKAAAIRIEELLAKREGRPPIPYAGVSPQFASRYLGSADITPYLQAQTIRSTATREKRKRVPLVRPLWCEHDVRMSKARWPLIAAYLEKKRLGAKQSRHQGESQT